MSHRNTWRAAPTRLLLGLLLTVASACWQAKVTELPTERLAEPPPERPRPRRVECKERSADVKLTLTLEPDPPGIGPHRLTVLVKDASSNLFVEADQVEVLPWMPLHGHGASVTPDSTRLLKGKYQIQPITFSMAGNWELHVTVMARGKKTVRCLQVEVGDFQVKEDPSTPKQEIPKDSTPPTLTSAPVNIKGSFDDATKRLGSLLCDQTCLVAFAPSVQEGQAPPGALRFVTQPGAAVYAVAPGVVESIQWTRHSHSTHSDLFKLVARANKDAAFSVVYQNIKGIKVKVGDQLKPGQPIGETGDGEDAKHNWMGLQIRRRQESHQLLCPANYFDAALEQQFTDARAQLTRAGVLAKGSQLCQSRSLLCADTAKGCQAASDFVAVKGDIDAGRRIYKASCGSCHGSKGEGGIGIDLCRGGGCKCSTCKQGHEPLRRRVALDMPPEGSCTEGCAEDVAAFILHAFQTAP